VAGKPRSSVKPGERRAASGARALLGTRPSGAFNRSRHSDGSPGSSLACTVRSRQRQVNPGAGSDMIGSSVPAAPTRKGPKVNFVSSRLTCCS